MKLLAIICSIISLNGGTGNASDMSQSPHFDTDDYTVAHVINCPAFLSFLCGSK